MLMMLLYFAYHSLLHTTNECTLLRSTIADRYRFHIKPKKNIRNLKTWQLQMHCNLRPPEPRQSLTASITTPGQVWRRWTYSLPYFSVFAADTLLYAVTFTFDPWPSPLTLNILQCMVCDVMKLCSQSSNTLWSYCTPAPWTFNTFVRL